MNYKRIISSKNINHNILLSKYYVNTLSSSNMNVYSLNSNEKQFLFNQGYLHISNFLSKNTTKNIRNRMLTLLKEFNPNESKSIFKAHSSDETNGYRDEYFLNSGDKIRYFWEENVFDNNGELIKNKELCINKVGHALHTLDPYFNSYVWGYLPNICYDIGFKDPIPLQSMYIFKQPGIGGEVGPHQDSPFLYTEPLSVYGLWLAIDNTNENNGCIWLTPKSHKNTGLKKRFKRIGNNQTKMFDLLDGNYDAQIKDGIPINAESGDLLIIHGELVHWSQQNTSNDPRHALMIHVIDGNCHYPDDNWLQYTKGKQYFPKFTLNDCNNQSNIKKLIDNM